MSILSEIYVWSKNLPAWQQDAIAKLYENRQLSDDDWDDLYALAKQEAGIEDAGKRIAKRLQEAQVASPPVPTRLVQLTAIKELSNLNALADGETLPIAKQGLTVVYGENGAGKSGYARALKHACRARDRSEPILPNANADPAMRAETKAVLAAIVDGQPQDFLWRYKSTSPEPLSEIAIFDTHCARAYIDNQGDFAYAPYGLDIIAGLVAACGKLKERASQEKAQNTPTDFAFATLAKEQTAVGKVLAGIPRMSTKPEEIKALATLSDAEVDRLADIVKALAEADPKQKAQALRQKAKRFENLATRVGAAWEIVGPQKLAELETLVRGSNAAKKAAELAAKSFNETPSQLPGTGGEEWKALFEAARTFAAVSHAQCQFPHLLSDSQCPLCQNKLGDDGVARLARFENFICQAVETAAKEARGKAATAYRVVNDAILDLALDDALREELAEIDAALLESCVAAQGGLSARQEAARQAASGSGTWDSVDTLPPHPAPALAKAVAKLRQQATALDASADEKARAALVAERAELDARRRLGEVKTAVLDAIAKHELCAKLQKCMDGMVATGISRKATELSRTMASQDLADALNEELKRLKVHQLQVVMKPESPGGRTQFKLALQLPGGGTPSAILSEGEQRAIAIASFLAEVKLGRGRGGVVFDDPVSSLDHRRRWEVAERLASEAKSRQVIVFTHDIYFLCILEQKAEELGCAIAKHYIRRTAKGFGSHAPELPFDAIGTKDRIGRLRLMSTDARRAQKNGDDDEHRRLTCETYRHLRLTWERAVEDVLFNGSIQRFGEGVKTQSLRQVVVTDDDYKTIDAGMTKSSKFEHDAASSVNRLPLPDPDELDADIKVLADWRGAVIARRDAIAASR